jgi:hypothetical protein
MLAPWLLGCRGTARQRPTARDTRSGGCHTARQVTALPGTE